jgi:sugar phosphate isomerase/epimerase
MIARNVLATRAEALNQVAQDRREQLAAEVYKIETVFELMAAAAAAGYKIVKIPSPVPIELANTKAAKALLEAFAGTSVKLEWVPRQPIDPTTGERFSELVAKW